MYKVQLPIVIRNRFLFISTQNKNLKTVVFVILKILEILKFLDIIYVNISKIGLRIFLIIKNLPKFLQKVSKS